MPVQLTVQQERVQEVTKALRGEEDGKQLRRDLAKNMRGALEPAVTDARNAVMTIASARSGAPPLRAGIAQRIRAEARLSGRATGARVRARRTPNLRGFTHAPKRTQSRKGWRRLVFGREGSFVTQVGKPRWFDDTVRRRAGEYRAAVKAAVDAMAKRIADRSR